MDEKNARHVLADMQAKISRSAYDALNITAGDVGPEHVRAAFLQLTKQFHPAKFARMAPEIQKLANEVFLGLRAAHDQLSRPKQATPPARQSQQIAFIANKTPNEAARSNNNASGIRPAPPAPVRSNAPPAPSASINPATVRGVQPAPSTVATTPQRGVAAQPATPTRLPTGQQPAVRPPATAAATRTGVGAPTPIRRMTPPGGVPAVKQPTPAGGMPASKPAAPGAEPELAGVYDQLQKGQFEQARATLNALIALQPKPRYRALVAYSIGREAQLANRRDEARVDLHEALEIDPELQLAKTALAELFTRRK